MRVDVPMSSACLRNSNGRNQNERNQMCFHQHGCSISAGNPTLEDEVQFRTMQLHKHAHKVRHPNWKWKRNSTATVGSAALESQSLGAVNNERVAGDFAPTHSYHLSTPSAPSERLRTRARERGTRSLHTDTWEEHVLQCCHHLNCLSGLSPTRCSASCTTARKTANCCCAG